MTYFLKEDLLNMDVGLAGFSLITSFFSKREIKNKTEKIMQISCFEYFFISILNIFYLNITYFAVFVVTGYEIIFFFKYIIYQLNFFLLCSQQYKNRIGESSTNSGYYRFSCSICFSHASYG